MATFHFELVSPDKQMFSGQAESVLVPGSEGDFVVLKDHAPVMASLKPGVIAIEDAAGKHKRIFVRGGFADVSPAGLIVLAETVHTTGVNWDGVLANVASITIIMGAFGALLLRAFRRSIKDEITDVIEREVMPKLDEITIQLRVHDTRIARLEGVEEGKRYAVDAAGVTKAPRLPGER